MRISLGGLGEPLRKKGDQEFYNCPYHEDEKGHLGVNLKKGIFHCFKCGVSGKLDDLKVSMSEYENKVKDFLLGKKEDKPKEDFKLSLPESFTKITQESGMAYRYLVNRGITYEEIEDFNIGYCTFGPFEERVIFPIYKADRLTYYVGRAYTPREPKYLNAPVPKAGNIFKTFVDRVDAAIICEGIFDAIKIGKKYPAICILGKVINGNDQIISIAKATKKAYVLLDRDAQKEGFIASQVLNYYIPTQVMLLEVTKDPGDLTDEQLEKILPK
jgi:DNA primase